MSLAVLENVVVERVSSLTLGTQLRDTCYAAINLERVRHGLLPLPGNDDSSWWAGHHAEEVAGRQADFLSPPGLRKGENELVSHGFTLFGIDGLQRIIERSVQAWMCNHAGKRILLDEHAVYQAAGTYTSPYGWQECLLVVVARIRSELNDII